MNKKISEMYEKEPKRFRSTGEAIHIAWCWS